MATDHILNILRDLGALALPVGVVATVSALLASWGLRRAGMASSSALLFFLAFAILGGIAGVMAGASLEAIVGALITGMLGLVSALLTLGFAKEGDPAVRAAIPPAIILLLANALIGVSVGQEWKKKWIIYSDMKAETKVEHEKLWLPVTLEYRKQALQRCAAENAALTAFKRACDPEALFD